MMTATPVLRLSRDEGRVYSIVAECATGSALFLADTVALLSAFAIAIFVRNATGGNALCQQYLKLTPFLVIIQILIGSFDLYPGVLLNAVEELRRLTIAIGVGMLLLVVAAFLIKEVGAYSRMVFVLAIPLAVGLSLAARRVARSLCAKASWWGIPTVLLGPPNELESVLHRIDTQPAVGIRVVDIIETDQSGVPVHVNERLTRGRIPYAMVVLPIGANREWVRGVEQVVWECKKIIVIPQSKALLWSHMSIRDCCGLIGLEVKRELLRRHSRIMKRVLDWTLALIAGMPLFLVTILIALAIRLTSPGPIFYAQRRIGEGGRPFRMWKFRTMVENADELLEGYLATSPELHAEWEASHKLQDDPRVTRIGRLLRTTSLDELPQIWNVIRGEMSLVGPRPIVEDEAWHYGREFEMYEKVRPGITGLWQVSGRSDTTYEERVAMDVYYVRNWSVWLDLYVLGRTAGAVLREEGAC